MSTSLARIARRQGGVFTHQQAMRCGSSLGDVQRRLLDGEWVQVLPRVYTASTTPVTPRLQAWAGVLAIGPPVMLAGRFAAACLGLERAPCFVEPEFAIPVNRHRREYDGVLVHRIRREHWFVERRHGLPVPPVATVIRQVAGTAPDHVVLRSSSTHSDDGR